MQTPFGANSKVRNVLLEGGGGGGGGVAEKASTVVVVVVGGKDAKKRTTASTNKKFIIPPEDGVCRIRLFILIRISFVMRVLVVVVNACSDHLQASW